MTRTKQQDKKKAACLLLVQCSIETYANLSDGCRFLNTFSKPHTESSNALIKLELHTTLLTPDLGTHAYMLVSCVESDFASFGKKKIYSSLFLLTFFDLGRQIHHS